MNTTVRVLSILLLALLSVVAVPMQAQAPLQDSEPIATPTFEPVTANADWEPVIQAFDDVEMVLVPAGCFMMGSTDEEMAAVIERCMNEPLSGTDHGVCCLTDEVRCNTWLGHEGPIHEVCFDAPFWIDRYEVTNAQFERLGGEAAYASYETAPDHPREQVTWAEARAFCELRGARLPTEAEWEYAARGPESWVYPWGNEFDMTRLNFCDDSCLSALFGQEFGYDDGYAGSAPVGTYGPAGDSWVGAADMVGNVWEQTSTLYSSRLYPYPYVSDDGREDASDTTTRRVWRGGAFNDGDTLTRASARVSFGFAGNAHAVGFRCVRSE